MIFLQGTTPSYMIIRDFFGCRLLPHLTLFAHFIPSVNQMQDFSVSLPKRSTYPLSTFQFLQIHFSKYKKKSLGPTMLLFLYFEQIFTFLVRLNQLKIPPTVLLYVHNYMYIRSQLLCFVNHAINMIDMRKAFV